MTITLSDIENMEKLERVQFATTLPGPKPICLVGTRSASGFTNLAPFSSITHLGSNPILIGMVTRPDTAERHTLANILATESWTLNHVTDRTLEQAHQCAARYAEDVSEFSATGLTELSHPGITAPFVAECPIRYALSLEEIVDIPSNGTKLIVGRVRLVDIPDGSYSSDGSICLASQESLASTALDTYFRISKHKRLPYAKP
ncbi:MAG: flavin reductase [Akkermansiaceae bacterium]|nr:flavin reductase [Akkermansiaceae bacterium]